MPNGKEACDEDRPEYMALNALKVVTLDAEIVKWLKCQDPKTLEQCQKAVAALEEKLQIDRAIEKIKCITPDQISEMDDYLGKLLKRLNATIDATNPI